MKRWSQAVVVAVLSLCVVSAAQQKKTGVLGADELSKVVPASYFFDNQVAPVQMRNTGGIHFADDQYVLAGMVDNSGYSTGLREKYQAYLITEVPLEIGGQMLRPGAYGMGFLEGGKFVVMDLAANDMLRAGSQRDAEMKRPMPLQVTGGEAGKYRLYIGREFVEFGRAK